MLANRCVPRQVARGVPRPLRRRGALGVAVIPTPPCIIHSWFSTQNIQRDVRVALASAPRRGAGCGRGGGRPARVADDARRLLAPAAGLSEAHNYHRKAFERHGLTQPLGGDHEGSLDGHRL
jgi:hypothetical protein